MIKPARTLDAVGDVLRSVGLFRELRGPGDVTVLGVCQDSREVQPGDLFLAWKGATADAHDFVAEAVANGAVAVMVERPVDADVPQLVVVRRWWRERSPALPTKPCSWSASQARTERRPPRCWCAI